MRARARAGRRPRRWYASSSPRDAVLVGAPGTVPSATASRRGWPVLDREPEAGRLDQLDVVLAVAERDDAVEVEPEPVAHLAERACPSTRRRGRTRGTSAATW